MSSATRTKIVELRRTGAGSIDETPTVFDWGSDSHSGAQGEIDFDLEVKTARHEMPGSDSVVEHVMAATWQPFDIQGEWNDRWAGAGFAWDTYLAFAQLVGRSPLVRFTLDQLSFVGILTKLKIKYRTRDLIYWTVTLSPHDNEAVGTFRRPSPVAQRSQSTDQWVSDVADKQAELHAALAEATQLQLVEDDVQDFATQIDEVDAAVDKARAVSAGNLEQDPTRQLLLLASSFRRVRAAGLSGALSISRQRSDTALAFFDVIQMFRLDSWRCGTISAGFVAAGIAREAEIDMRARAGRKSRAIYRPRRGESLERISLRFYGTADSWRLIYDANHLESLVLDGSEQLIIPERAA